MELISIQPNQASVDGFLEALKACPDVQVEQDRFFEAFLNRARRVHSQALSPSNLCITTLCELTKTTEEFVRFPKLVETIMSHGMRMCTDGECIALYTQVQVLVQYPSILCIMDPVVMNFDYNGPNAVDTPFCLAHHPDEDVIGQKRIGLYKVAGSMMFGIPSDITICVAFA